LKWPLYRWFIPKFDACLAVGKWSKDYYLHYGASPDRIFFVPHVIDDERFARAAELNSPHRSELRQRWQLRNEATVFLFIGKFIQKKRPLDFIEAVSRVARRGGDVMGLMVGDGPLRRECEEIVMRSDAPVKFAGFLNQSEIISAYVAADALVLPSDGGETWGLVVNEAMSCGLPCFVSDQVGCGPDMIAPSETGAIFSVGDTEALANLLISYAGDRTMLSRMSGPARQMAKRNSVSVAVEGVIEALAAVRR
jgi:glycosyltransferase involved in cell wall biosynthesis